jgi:citrate synthase
VRGHDLCDDLIGKIGFTDYFWLLVLGEKPTDAQRDMMDACLVAIAEHGLVPSVQAARMTLAAGPDAWQGAMAAGLLGMGSVVAGSLRNPRVVPRRGDREGRGQRHRYRNRRDRQPEGLKQGRKKVPGLGHPQHNRAATRGPTGCWPSPTISASRALHRDLRILGRARAGHHRAAPADQRLGRDSRPASRRGLAARSHQGGAAAGAHGRPVGASLRGITALDRVHHVPQGGSGHRI